MKNIDDALKIVKEKMKIYLSPANNKYDQFYLYFVMQEFEIKGDLTTEQLLSFLKGYYNCYITRYEYTAAFQEVLLGTIETILGEPPPKKGTHYGNEHELTDIDPKTKDKPWLTTTEKNAPKLTRSEKEIICEALKNKLSSYITLNDLRKEFLDFRLHYNSKLRYSDRGMFEHTHSYIKAISYFVDQAYNIIKRYGALSVTEKDSAFLQALYNECEELNQIPLTESIKSRETLNKMSHIIDLTLYHAMVSVEIDKQQKFDQLKKLHEKLCSANSINKIAEIYANAREDKILNTPRKRIVFSYLTEGNTISDSHAFLLVIQRLQKFIKAASSLDSNEIDILVKLHIDITQRFENFTAEIAHTSLLDELKQLRESMKEKLPSDVWEKIYIPVGIGTVTRRILGKF